MGAVAKPGPGLSELLKTTRETPESFHKFFNLKRIADTTGINLDKIYNNMNELYNSLSKEDRKRIADALAPNVVKLFSKLGYDVVIKKAKA